MVPLLSPFRRNGEADLDSLEKLLHLVSSHGCQPFVLGTTGEGASIPDTEKRKIVKAAAKHRRTDLKIYACVTATCLESAIDTAKEYADMGVNAIAAPLPFYYPLSDSDITRWYESLAEQSPCPVLLYNIPATTHRSIPLPVADQLSKHPNIEGIKDSEKSESRLSAALRLWKDREDFSHLMGWAGGSYLALTQGSDGLVPSSGNLVPDLYLKLYETALSGATGEAMELQRRSDEVGKIYQEGRLLGESLAALKVLAAAQDLCEPYVLPPIQQLSAEQAESLKKSFTSYTSNY